ncbi:MAG: hypothetical protein ACOZDY_16085 [Pseudomonadota bacterium]
MGKDPLLLTSLRGDLGLLVAPHGEAPSDAGVAEDAYCCFGASAEAAALAKAVRLEPRQAAEKAASPIQ